MRLAASALALGLALPQAGLACAQLSEHVWMCDRGTPWETAQWDAAGDGSARILGDVVLSFTEQWPGHEIGDDLATLQERFVTYEEWMRGDDLAPLEVHAQQVFDIPAGQVFRSLQRDAVDGAELVSAVMLAQVGEARIMLFMDTPADTAWPALDTMSRAALDLLRPACADEVSCAEDYEPPLADARKRG